MPLTLVTGPANAGKAQVVLDGVRAQARRDPILVVPTAADAGAYRRELAAGGAVFGVRAMTFAGLAREIATRAGSTAETLGPAQRERLVEAAVAGTQWRALGASAASRGFVAAAGALVAELQRELVTPQRFVAAMRAWGSELGREDYAHDVAAIYAGYRSRLDRLGRVDSDLLAWRALDALRAAPARWGTTPVFLYGFDDLTRLQRDAVETLARCEGVEVTVALTWEDRAALASRASTFQELAPLADRHVALPARADYYDSPALHHLERALFEEEAERVDPDGAEQRRPQADDVRVDPGGAVRLLEAGGERAEAELVAATVLEQLGAGVPAEEIAIVLRAPGERAGLLRSVLESYGVPVAVAAPMPFGRAALGRGLLGLLRAGLETGRAGDLLAWLRTPGVLERPELADALEADVRRRGARTAEEARRLWEERRWPLDELDRVQGAGPALLDAVADMAERLLAAPRRRAAAVLEPDERLDAAALRAALQALGGLRALARQDPTLAPSPAELLAALERLEVRVEAPPGAVAVLDPLAIRARRVRALFACGLQEGEFPRPPRSEPFLPDAVRRELALASGLRLRQREDRLDDERALFYAVASRPEAFLGLSYRTSDEEGRPAVRSFFVDDVRDVFTSALDEERARRPLAAVTWPSDHAPTERERMRAEAAAGPRLAAPAIASLRAPAVLDELAGRESWSAAHLEAYAGCPVQWLVDRVLRPESFEPESEPLARGTAAHALLEATLRRLREETGSARLDERSLPRAREILERELDERGPELSPDPARARSLHRRLQADLLRYLRRQAERPTAFEPAHLELDFGGPDDELPALALDGLRVRGRIDRVDADGQGHAAVCDYKGASAYPVARWAPEGRLQVALYMLAVREALGLELAAGFYQATTGGQATRGVVREDSPLAATAVSTDRRDAAGLEAVLADAAARAEAVARRLVAGELEARPDSCGWDNRCQYPEVCRCER